MKYMFLCIFLDGFMDICQLKLCDLRSNSNFCQYKKSSKILSPLPSLVDLMSANRYLMVFRDQKKEREQNHHHVIDIVCVKNLEIMTLMMPYSFLACSIQAGEWGTLLHSLARR